MICYLFRDNELVDYSTDTRHLHRLGQPGDLLVRAQASLLGRRVYAWVRPAPQTPTTLWGFAHESTITPEMQATLLIMG